MPFRRRGARPSADRAARPATTSPAAGRTSWSGWSSRSGARSARPGLNRTRSPALRGRCRGRRRGRQPPTLRAGGRRHPVVPCCCSTRSWPGCSRQRWSWRRLGAPWPVPSRLRSRRRGHRRWPPWAGSASAAQADPAAVAADPGWRLVVADAAQLEPRVLAAMAGDAALARASRGHDLYAGLVTEGVVGTRPQAKLAMLSALYGATAGEAGQLMPNLMRAYPAATGLVERAARDGERGQQVHTWLGRTSPPPGPGWHDGQQRANQPDAVDADERRARREARAWGRFTRNFVVQGSAAEWALCWLAAVRRDLTALAGSTTPAPPRPGLFPARRVMCTTPRAGRPGRGDRAGRRRGGRAADVRRDRCRVRDRAGGGRLLRRGLRPAVGRWADVSRVVGSEHNGPGQGVCRCITGRPGSFPRRFHPPR